VTVFLPDDQTARSASTRRSTNPAGFHSCDDTSRGDAGKRIAQPICHEGRLVGPTAIFFSPVEFRALSSRARIFQIDGGRADVANWRTRGADDGSRIRRLSETFNKAGDFEVERISLVRRAIVPRS
jgi:hypothetical protein